MAYQIRTERRPNTFGLDDQVYVLGDDAGNLAEIWPALGFNWFRWRVGGQELLYADPKILEEKKPTRSGIPILFPFPNRIRAGRFNWAGKEYRLPTTDSTGKNAIHGFVC